MAPACGARLVAFRIGGRDVLRPATEAMLRSAFPYGFAAFPLMPYSGPLFGPGFGFAGEDHVLARNVREEPSATHGDSWIAPFEWGATNSR